MSFFGRFFSILILLVSAIETVAIASLVFLAGVVALPTAIGIRFALFTVEHIVSFIRVNGAGRLTGLDLGRVLIVAAIETATWEIWFVLAGLMGLLNQALAVVVLFGGLYVGHTFEQNTIRLCPNFFAGLARTESLGFTAIETVTGIVWRILAVTARAFLPLFDLRPLGVVAAIVLFLGLNVEHTVSAGKPRRCY